MRIQLRAGRNRVVPGLKTGNGRDDDVEGDLPHRSVLWGRRDGEVIASRDLKEFSELETAIGNNPVVLVLIGTQGLRECLGLGVRRILRENAQVLSADHGADVDVMTKDGDVSRRDRERNLGEGWVERLNVDDLVFLLMEAESAEQALDFELGIRGPNTDVVAVLIRDTGVLSVEFDVDAVPVRVRGEQLASDGNWSGEGVLRIVNTLGAGECTRR